MSGGNFRKSGTEVYRISRGCCAKSGPAPKNDKPRTNPRKARLIRITSQQGAPHHTRLASRAPITRKTQNRSVAQNPAPPNPNLCAANPPRPLPASGERPLDDREIDRRRATALWSCVEIKPNSRAPQRALRASARSTGSGGDPPVRLTFPDQACTGSRNFRGCQQTPPPAGPNPKGESNAEKWDHAGGSTYFHRGSADCVVCAALPRGK